MLLLNSKLDSFITIEKIFIPKESFSKVIDSWQVATVNVNTKNIISIVSYEINGRAEYATIIDDHTIEIGLWQQYTVVTDNIFIVVVKLN